MYFVCVIMMFLCLSLLCAVDNAELDKVIKALANATDALEKRPNDLNIINNIELLASTFAKLQDKQSHAKRAEVAEAVDFEAIDQVLSLEAAQAVTHELDQIEVNEATMHMSDTENENEDDFVVLDA